MSRLYDTLRRMEKEKQRPDTVSPELEDPVELLKNIIDAPEPIALQENFKAPSGDNTAPEPDQRVELQNDKHVELLNHVIQELGRNKAVGFLNEPVQVPKKDNAVEPVEMADGPRAKTNVSEKSRLVALTDPKSLGAEKFRALVARLENLRERDELKSLQVTSAVVNEGKSLVAANLAVTLVRHFGYRVLLVEGDLHRPTIGLLLGLGPLEGINQWWRTSGEESELAQYIYQLDDMGLSFLGAGSACDQPTQILQSARFAKAFVRLVGRYDWVVVDSTPMSPIVDVNLWSRLVDGALLVVREGVAPVKALQMGVKGLDNPKWLGIVLNEASEFDSANYSEEYYGVRTRAKVNARG